MKREDDVNTSIDQVPHAEEIRRVAVVVAHPDDETLWAGGLLMSHPEWSPFIVTLCRGKDPDRAPKFRKALETLNAKGAMGDLNDGPDQIPLADTMVRNTILSLVPAREFDLLLTHGPHGEYTRHRRHEEVARVVWGLWLDGNLRAGRLWQFAYEDDGGACFPKPRKNASFHLHLSDALWTRKYQLITRVYGFGVDSWEARAVTRTEAFQTFTAQESIDSPHH